MCVCVCVCVCLGMVRCTLRRLVTTFCVLSALLLLGLITTNHFLVVQQKTIIRYQIENQLRQYWDKSLDPQTGKPLCAYVFMCVCLSLVVWLTRPLAMSYFRRGIGGTLGAHAMAEGHKSVLLRILGKFTGVCLALA